MLISNVDVTSLKSADDVGFVALKEGQLPRDFHVVEGVISHAVGQVNTQIQEWLSLYDSDGVFQGKNEKLSALAVIALVRSDLDSVRHFLADLSDSALHPRHRGIRKMVNNLFIHDFSPVSFASWVTTFLRHYHLLMQTNPNEPIRTSGNNRLYTNWARMTDRAVDELNYAVK